METRKRLLLEDDEAPAMPQSAPAPRLTLDALPPSDEAQASAAPAAIAATSHWPLRRIALLGGIALGGSLLLMHTVFGLIELTRDSPLLGLAWSTAFVLVTGAAGRAALLMWRRLRVLRTMQRMRERARVLLAHNGVSEGVAFCEELARTAHAEQRPEYARWKQTISATHNNREVLLLYGRTVLAEADQRALERVSRHAGDVTVMVAVSYFPAVDMLLVLWRQLRLIEDVCASYGVDVGYWGRIELLRKVLRNMALAGAAEIAAEVGAEVLGAGVAARLSAAAAQGLAAGVLTARLGLRTMQECRAIDWEDGQRPRLREVTMRLVSTLGQFVGSGKA